MQKALTESKIARNADLDRNVYSSFSADSCVCMLHSTEQGRAYSGAKCAAGNRAHKFLGPKKNYISLFYLVLVIKI